MLDKKDVDRMVREATEHADEDRKRREEVETRNQAEALTFQAERTLKDLGDKVSAEDRAAVEGKVSDVRERPQDASRSTWSRRARPSSPRCSSGSARRPTRRPPPAGDGGRTGDGADGGPAAGAGDGAPGRRRDRRGRVQGGLSGRAHGGWPSPPPRSAGRARPRVSRGAVDAEQVPGAADAPVAGRWNGPLRGTLPSHASSPSCRLIHARGLTKRFGGFTAVDADRLRRGARRVVRLPRPERRRQDHHDADDRLRLPGDRPARCSVLGMDPATDGPADPRPARRRAPAGHAGHGADRPREPPRSTAATSTCRGRSSGQRVDELLDFVQLDRARERPGRAAVGRDEAAPHDRPQPRQRARPAPARRADDRPRPAGPPPALGPPLPAQAAGA